MRFQGSCTALCESEPKKKVARQSKQSRHSDQKETDFLARAKAMLKPSRRDSCLLRSRMLIAEAKQPTLPAGNWLVEESGLTHHTDHRTAASYLGDLIGSGNLGICLVAAHG